MIRMIHAVPTIHIVGNQQSGMLFLAFQSRPFTINRLARLQVAMNENRPSLEELTKRLIEFRDARDWRQFHSLKDLILSLNLEAGELLELTQWKSEVSFESEAGTEAMRQRLAEECSDVLLYLLLIAERAGIDVQAAAAEKITANELKYPVEKARGTAAKYTDL